MSACTAPECGIPSDLYLCSGCTNELADLLAKVSFLWVNLDPTLQATKQTKKIGSEGGGGFHAGSKPAANLDAATLRGFLACLPQSAPAEAARNPEAGRTLFMARLWVTNAERLVYGEKPKPAKDADEARERIKENENLRNMEPLGTSAALKWIRDNSKISIASSDIWNWVREGKLTRTNADEKKARPTYRVADILKVHFDHVSKNKRHTFSR